MKRAPKLFRRKKAGKQVGNWFVTVRDVPVNLGTKDAGLAMKRRGDALKGTRNFVDDVDAAADDTVKALAPVPPPLEPSTPETPPPIDADEVIPPPPGGSPGSEPHPEGWAASVDAAAADDTPEADKPDPSVPKPGFHVTIEDVAKILGMPAENLAPLAVEAQIKAVEWIGNLRGYELAKVPPEDVGRVLLAAGYVPIIRLLQAEDLKIHPGWFIVAGSIAIVTTQLAGAKKKPDAKAADAPATA
jgi:hypothetical protein